MDVKSASLVSIDFYNITIKHKLRKSESTDQKSELNKEISDHLKLSKPDKNNKLFQDRTYRMLVSIIKRSNISNQEKKLILQMMVNFFKNGPDEKMKGKFAKQINSLIAAKEFAEQSKEKRNSASSGSNYSRQSIDDYLDTLEKDAMLQIKLNEELQQVTSHIPNEGADSSQSS